MQTDEVFFPAFRDWVLEKESIKAEEEKEALNAEESGNQPIQAAEIAKSTRVSFLMHQMDMVPKGNEVFYDNLMEAYPTSPVYLLLALGTLGTNIARYSAVRRLEGTRVIRTGCFYKFLAPSRFGKGVVMGLIDELGTHVEKKRQAYHESYIIANQHGLHKNQTGALLKVKQQCDVLQPGLVFLEGGNALQTQATAATNGGCGLICISEIKSGKCAYTDPDGSYGSLLKFYDEKLRARSFRQAEHIPRIGNCRIQMIAAGIKEDWVPFVEKSGIRSGLLARIIPVLSFDREVVRLGFQRMPKRSFCLDGLKKVLGILEAEFEECNANDLNPPLTLQFSNSVLDSDYRNTNKHLVADCINGPVIDLRGKYRRLIDSALPSTTQLKQEGSGFGLISVF